MNSFMNTLLWSGLFVISSIYTHVHGTEYEIEIAKDAISKSMQGDYASKNLEVPQSVLKNLSSILRETLPDQTINISQNSPLTYTEFEDGIIIIKNMDEYKGVSFHPIIYNLPLSLHKRIDDSINITQVLTKYYRTPSLTPDCNNLPHFWYQFISGFVNMKEINIEQENANSKPTLTLYKDTVKQFIEKINDNPNLVKNKYELSIPNFYNPIEVLLPGGIKLSTDNIKEIEPNPLVVKDPKSIIKTIYINPNYQNYPHNITNISLQKNTVMVDMSSIVILKDCKIKDSIFTLGTLCCVVVSVQNTQSNDIGLAHIQGSNIDKVLSPYTNPERNSYEKINDNTLRHSMSDFLNKMSNSHRDDIVINIAGGQHNRYLILKIAEIIAHNDYNLEPKNIYFSKPFLNYDNNFTFDIDQFNRFDSGISKQDGFYMLKDPKIFLDSNKPLSEIKEKWSSQSIELLRLDDLITEHLGHRKKMCDQFNKVTMYEIVKDSSINTQIYYPAGSVLVGEDGSREFSPYI